MAAFPRDPAADLHEGGGLRLPHNLALAQALALLAGGLAAQHPAHAEPRLAPLALGSPGAGRVLALCRLSWCAWAHHLAVLHGFLTFLRPLDLDRLSFLALQSYTAERASALLALA